MRRFVLGWKTLGHEQRLDARLVNYADDFRDLQRGRAKAAMDMMRGIMGKLKLTVNEKKTRICRLPEGTFSFLGYTFGRLYSFFSGRADTIWGVWPPRMPLDPGHMPGDQRTHRPTAATPGRTREGGHRPELCNYAGLVELLQRGDCGPSL